MAVTADVDAQPRPWLGTADVGADECVPLILGGGPVASHQALLSWWVDTLLLTDVDHYDLSFTCPPSAACPGVVNAGNNRQYFATGLTNGATYGVTVTARNGANQALGVSNYFQLTPVDQFVRLPLIQR
jgi:hypothetical protein